MNIVEKASYVKGFAKGLDLDESKKETKVINALIDVIGEMAEELSELGFAYDDLCDQVDTIDEDLGMLEENVYQCDGDCMSECCEKEAEEEGTMFEVTCPSCGKSMILSEEDLSKGEISCLNCGTNLEFDIDEDGNTEEK